MMSYERSCRLCLTELTEPPVDCSTIPEIYETVAVLFNVQICRTDNIRSICNGCLDYVMGYRALRKKITECQKIIEDFENVRKKVMANRNSAALAFKQEIVDVEAYECTQIGLMSPKRSRPTAVTDSDINDILALVHDSSAVSRKGKASRVVKSEPQSPICLETDNCSLSTESISSTSKDLIELHALTKKSSFIESTSAEEVSMASSKSFETRPHTSLDIKPTSIDAHAVSSSVGTPTEIKTKPQIFQKSSRKRTNSSITPPARSGRRQTEKSPENPQFSNDCKICHLKFKSIADLKTHLRTKHKVKLENSSMKTDPKSNKDDPVTSSDNQYTSMRRTTRQTTTQAQQRETTTTAKCSASSLRRSNRMEKITDTPNNSLVEPQITSTPVSKRAQALPAKNNLKNNNNNNTSAVINHSVKSENMSSTFENSTFLKDTSLNNSKRIITITLVRSKDSLNFRYCDQYKRNIDFKNVSPDELEEMRKSLLVPEIWNNLREAFRNSPPDEKTFDQLKAILGDDFIL